MKRRTFLGFLMSLIASKAFASPFMVLPKRGSAWSSSGGYGADICTGGTASASFTLSAEYNADKAFDDDMGTGWLSSSNENWVQYQLAEAKTALRITLRLNDKPNTSLALKGSNTGAYEGEEVTLWSDTQQLDNSDDYPFDLTTTGSYVYYRLYTNAGGNSVQVFNMQLLPAAD